MADAVISFAVEKLGDALIEKVMFLKAVEDDVRWLNGELQSMQSFLTDAAEKQAKDERISRWISDIREVALDAEDAIGIFVLKVENTRRNRGPLGGSACLPAQAYHLNRVGEEIQSIRKRLDDIRNRRQTYAIKNLGEGMSTVLDRRSEDVERRRRLSPWEKDKHLVGLDDDVQVLLQKLNLEKKTNGLSIGAIVGMGGIGKSTLARKIYNHDAVANHFECRAWVVVSSAFTLEETIKQVILELHKSTEDKIKSVKDIQVWEGGTTDKLFLQAKLKEMLHKQLLGKSYFIVLDDVWEREHWESLVSAFPNEQDKSGRLLFTSRNQVITQFDGYVHKMKFLNPDESWELLMKTAFNSRECPQEVEETARLILRKCEGLPLPITVAGVLLLNLQGESKNGWQKILDRIDNYHLGINRNGYNIVSAILELSYRNLPPELKTCFLCLGFFKKGSTIRAKKLIRIWVAQGFIKQEGEKTMEETARGYLNELINRNLVQVKEMNISNNEVRSCGVHDLLRKLSLRQAEKELSFEIVKVEKDGTCTPSQPNPRHHAVYFGGSWQGMFIDSSSFGNQRRLRSLFFHQNGKSTLVIHPSYWKSLELLRVLDFEEYSNLQGTLIGLRYLGLRGTKIRYLPRSLSYLKNLEVLDAARVKFILRVPNVIWRI